MLKDQYDGTEEETLQLFRDFARADALDDTRNKGLINKGKIPSSRFIPLYKHPLPISNHRYKHEINLRRILSCDISKQAKGNKYLYFNIIFMILILLLVFHF